MFVSVAHPAKLLCACIHTHSAVMRAVQSHIHFEHFHLAPVRLSKRKEYINTVGTVNTLNAQHTNAVRLVKKRQHDMFALNQPNTPVEPIDAERVH